MNVVLQSSRFYSSVNKTRFLVSLFFYLFIFSFLPVPPWQWGWALRPLAATGEILIHFKEALRQSHRAQLKQLLAFQENHSWIWQHVINYWNSILCCTILGSPQKQAGTFLIHLYPNARHILKVIAIEQEECLSLCLKLSVFGFYPHQRIMKTAGA